MTLFLPTPLPKSLLCFSIYALVTNHHLQQRHGNMKHLHGEETLIYPGLVAHVLVKGEDWWWY